MSEKDKQNERARKFLLESGICPECENLNFPMTWCCNHPTLCIGCPFSSEKGTVLVYEHQTGTCYMRGKSEHINVSDPELLTYLREKEIGHTITLVNEHTFGGIGCDYWRLFNFERVGSEYDPKFLQVYKELREFIDKNDWVSMVEVCNQAAQIAKMDELPRVVFTNLY